MPKARTPALSVTRSAQRLGVPMDKIRFLHGDSDVAKTRIPGASATTTLASAIWNARDHLVRELLKHIDVRFVDRPDPQTPLGAKGIGELGIVGVAAAITNAIYHATGKRVRALPITPDTLLP